MYFIPQTENRFLGTCLSKFVTLYTLSGRNWKPKSTAQAVVISLTKLLPRKLIALWCYKGIYKCYKLSSDFVWCYFITPAKFKQGIFDQNFFSEAVDISFEDTFLLGSKYVKEYLTYRYGDYMKLPSIEKRNASVHTMIYDSKKDDREYMEKINE